MFLKTLLVSTCVLWLSTEIVATERNELEHRLKETRRYPYLAALLEAKDEQPFCAGTLIAPNVVLTARSCDTPRFVSVGCQHLETVGASCEIFKVKEVIKTPDEDTHAPTPLHDYALIALDGVSMNKPVSYFARVEDDLSIAAELTAVSWNPASVIAGRSNELLEVKMEYAAEEACTKRHEMNLFDNQLCVQRLEVMETAQSKGIDDGSPLILHCGTTGEDVLVGVASYGMETALSIYPTAYSQVSVAFDVILKTVEEQGYGLIHAPKGKEICTDLTPRFIKKAQFSTLNPLFQFEDLSFYQILLLILIVIGIGALVYAAIGIVATKLKHKTIRKLIDEQKQLRVETEGRFLKRETQVAVDVEQAC